MAKITNIKQLTETISDLTTNIDLPNTIFSDRMISDEINTLMTSIQNCFNALYIKCRQLEDLHDFIERYIQSQGLNINNIVSESKKILENASTDYKDTTSVSNLCKFTTTNILVDRDGSSISHAEIIDNSIVVPGNEILSNPEFNSCISESDDLPYRQIKLPVENYRTFYALERIANNGITEEVRFLFNKHKTINFIRLSTFNSSIYSIYLIRHDDQLIPININDNTIKEIDIKGISIRLKSTTIQELLAEVSDLNDSFSTMSEEYTNNILDTLFNTIILQKGDAINVYQQNN